MEPDFDPLVLAIPADAVEVLDRRTDYALGYNLTYRCEHHGVLVGSRTRSSEGVLMIEHALRNGQRHGRARRWTDDGELIWASAYVDGLEHGTASQYQDGQLLGTYTMEYGTGLDLWRNADGSLSEERHMKDGQFHGFERWWNLDNRSVWQESHFKHGVEHGIFRRWNHRGRLRRGLPRYIVNGQRVTKRQYVRVAALDPSLPPFSPEDNEPFRELPSEHFASLAPGLRRAQSAERDRPSS